MPNTARVAGLAIIVFAVAGIAMFVLLTAAPRMGFEDTDDPSVMLRFISANPDIFTYAGLAMMLMAISLTVATFAVANVFAGPTDLAVRSVSAFGLFTAGFFLLSGALHVQASGPLLHMAGLRAEWGQSAFLAFQVASQATGILGLFTLSIWAVGLSLIGLRTKVIPAALSLVGILPAFRIVAVTLGPLDLLPDGAWILGMLSIPGVFLWCLLLGLVLLRQGFGAAEEPRVAPAVVAA